MKRYSRLNIGKSLATTRSDLQVATSIRIRDITKNLTREDQAMANFRLEHPDAANLGVTVTEHQADETSGEDYWQITVEGEVR